MATLSSIAVRLRQCSYSEAAAMSNASLRQGRHKAASQEQKRAAKPLRGAPLKYSEHPGSDTRPRLPCLTSTRRERASHS
eukprot:474772-Pleurochrysis_carterae.AAC.1